MRRTCSRCGESRPLTDYAGQPGGTIDCYCRPCRAEYGREHYERHRARYIAQAKRRKDAVQAENYRQLIRYLRDHPCLDCGEDDVLVLEFDHVADKSYQVAPALRFRFWEDVLSEIAKCEVVCANCHRRRTARRGGWARVAAALEAERDPAA